MKKIIFKGFLFIGLLILTINGYGQFALSYHLSNSNKIGFGYNFSKTTWLDLRINNVSDQKDFSPELALLFNVVKKEKHEIYIGLCGAVNVDVDSHTNIGVPIGLQFRPIESFKRFSIQIELQPGIKLESEISMNIKSSAGIRYTFGD
jgi:hypothetical protein